MTNPAAVGVVYPRASFTRGGKAQALTDQDSAGSERISGCDLFGPTVDSAVTSGNIQFSTVFSSGLSNLQAAPITPSTISARLQAIEEMYQWWAIRRIKFTYIPNVGSTTVGSVALGCLTDVAQLIAGLLTAPTQQEVLELNPAMLIPVWGSSAMELLFRGTKLHASYNSGADEDTDSLYQAALIISGIGPVTATKLGQIWVDYDIDFYQQTPLLSGVDLFRKGIPCPRCRQMVLRDPRLPRLRGDEKKQDRDDDFVVLRTSEPQQGSGPSPSSYPGLEKPTLRREESKAQSTLRSFSLKG
jgi:hypothetical protein